MNTQNPTFLVVALNVAIITALVIIGIYTSNPLVILGLLMLQQIPVFGPQDEQASACMGVSEDEIPTHDSDDTTMGFMAELPRLRKAA